MLLEGIKSPYRGESGIVGVGGLAQRVYHRARTLGIDVDRTSQTILLGSRP